MSLNQWVYGAANPITMWDPTGMKAIAQTGGCGGDMSAAACQDIGTGFEASGWKSPEATVWTSDGYTRNHPAPPPPEAPAPKTSPAAVDGVLDVASSVTGISGQLAYFWSRSLEEQADHIFASAGMGFLGNPATELWIAKSGLLRGAARTASRLGGALSVAAGALTISKYYDRNDGDIPETVLDAGTELGWAAVGAVEGAAASAGACALVFLPAAPICGVVGGVFGGYFLGEFGEEVSSGNNV